MARHGLPRVRGGKRLALLLLGMLALVEVGPVRAQGWNGFGSDPQHTGLARTSGQIPRKIRWSTPVDLAPQYSGNGDLLTHFGSPLITKANTVLVPVKGAAYGGFRVEARSGVNGKLIWTFNSDYALPRFNWVPSFGPTIRAGDGAVVMPGAGGTVLVRYNPESSGASFTRLAFHDLALYNRNATAFNRSIQICTPITSDNQGNIFFGYVSDGAALPGFPKGIPSGLARISFSGKGTYATAASLANDNTIKKVAYNCAPAVSVDGASVYVAVNAASPTQIGSFSRGALCRANSTTLARMSSVALFDARGGTNQAVLSDDGTASPTIGPDGDVYFGVLESSFPSNHARGWLLHFDSTLAKTKIPGAFGWDDSASIVPATAVPSYKGTSTYLVLTKYNNYSNAGIGGDGKNKVAILDPNTTGVDPVTGLKVMREVITVLGVTPSSEGAGVREWCINSVAVDPYTRAAVVNSEDGRVYRWDFVTNTLSTGLRLAPPLGEAYTPTLIGPDGAVYAINNGQLFCCVAF
ncbi:MAG: hypothetical protein U0794_23110 [Isosphaeraceae bacterium]